MTAVVQLHAGQSLEPDAIKSFVKSKLGGVKAPKQIEIWPDLPRSKVGKVLKGEIRARLIAAQTE